MLDQTLDAAQRGRADDPVCAPCFLSEHGPFERPEDLRRAPLIHDTSRQWWIDWFLAAGLMMNAAPGGIIVDEYGLALQFALDGHGVALARDPLVDRDLASGALVRLFDVDITPRFAYYLAYDAVRATSPEAELVMGWLRNEAEQGVTARREHRA